MDMQDDEPRYHIVSVRISARERDILYKHCGATNRSVSDVMRDAMHLLPPFDELDYPALAR